MISAFRQNPKLVTVGLAGFIAMGAGQALYGPALPAFGRALELELSTVGLMVILHTLGCSIGVAAMFIASQAFSPRLALIAMALSSVLIAFAPSWGLTILGVLGYGFGYGIVTVTYNRVFLSQFGDKGPMMLTILNTMFGIGAIIAPTLFVLAHNEIFPIWIGLALFCASASLLAQKPAAPPERALPTATQSPFRPRFGILAFGAAGIGLEACLMGLGPTAMLAAGHSEAVAAELTSLFFVAFVAMRLAIAGFSNRMPAFLFFTIALAALLLTALAVSIIGPSIAAPAFVLAGALVAPLFPTFYLTAAREMGDHPRTSPAIIGAGLFGGTCTPLMIGAGMAAQGGLWFFPMVTVVASACLFCAIIRLYRSARLPKAAPQLG